LVRAELAVAIQWYIVDFETRFAELCAQLHKSTLENDLIIATEVNSNETINISLSE
jgi:predicted component of type VI protein secretion system